MAEQKNNTLPLIVALLITGGIIGGGAWLLLGGQKSFEINGVPVTLGNDDNVENAPTTTATENNSTTAPTTATGNLPFAPPTQVASGTQIFIDGSTSMVQINTALKSAFESAFSGTRVELAAQGSSNGIEALKNGSVDIAASSRPLTPEESNAGLKSVPIVPDQIALVVGKDNAFRGSVSTSQVMGIFTGQITNWSEVGGANAPIRVINRPPVSGTYTSFKEMVLNGQDVTVGTTLERDETTGLLQQLGTDGIGYATYSQVKDQATVRSIPVDNFFPDQPEYPYQRQLFYVYKEPATPAAQAFIGFIGSPAGQAALNQAQ
jgi:phosphate transport system substrate-binding protein